MPFPEGKVAFAKQMTDAVSADMDDTYTSSDTFADIFSSKRSPGGIMKVRITKRSANVEDIPIRTEFIKLQDFLKFANAVESGGMAKNMILAEEVQVNGEVCTMRGKKLRPGDVVSFNGGQWRVTEDAAE